MHKSAPRMLMVDYCAPSSDALEHEPSGLFSDAQLTGDLAATDTGLART